MQQQLIQAIVDEARTKLVGRFLGRIFQLSPLSFALDFGVRSGEYLFISADPSSPRLYLIKRRSKELEKQSIQPTQFAQAIRSKLGDGKIINIEKEVSDRVVLISFQVPDELGTSHFRRLVIQLTGKSANLFLLDERDHITDALRRPKGAGQQLSEIYQPPPRREIESQDPEVEVGTDSPSAVADSYFKKLDESNRFLSRVNTLRATVHRRLLQRQKLKTNLEQDLVNHGDPGEHKKMGDLLLANLHNAVRNGRKVLLTDYYENDATIEVELDEDSSLQEEAARQFRQYTKAKKAREEIGLRLSELKKEIPTLEAQQQQIDTMIRDRDEQGLERFATSAPPSQKRPAKSDEPQPIPGVRRYVSSDGYEVLVGRAARDNDNLTFRLARPHDLWLHAGDYPGSHVIVRNPTRKEIPQRTLLEAAQLAGKFSQASEDAKVVIHYTERKFLSKPKGSAPGLVRMSSFRSITVEPKEAINRA